MDWYPWNSKVYMADTLDFTLAEDGAYRRLIDYYMETRAPIPANKVALCRILGIGQDEFDAIAKQVLGKFTEIDGELHHKTCNDNLDKQDSLSKKRSEVAKSAHRKRHKIKAVTPVAEQLHGNSTDTRQDKTGERKKNTKKKLVNQFDDFWKAYPKKRGKGVAPKAYDKALDIADHGTIMAGLSAAMRHWSDKGTEEQFIPNPATWLNQQRWQDEYDSCPAGPVDQAAIKEAARVRKVANIKTRIIGARKSIERYGGELEPMLARIAESVQAELVEVRRIAESMESK